jgi:adenylate cyclase
MVNRTARINGSAGGGEIMCSLDVLREIQARVKETGPETEYSWAQPPQAIAAIRQLGITLIDKGIYQLKGLELPETLTLIYPDEVAGRQQLSELLEDAKPPESARPRVRLSASLIRQLAVIAVRLETLATGRVYRPFVQRKGSVVSTKDATDQNAQLENLPSDLYLVAEENLLVPPIHDKATDSELEVVLDSLATRIENALLSISLKHTEPLGAGQAILSALQRRGGIDQRMLEQILTFLEGSDGEDEDDTFTVEE